MQTYLIISQTEQEGLDYIHNVCKKEGIGEFDITHLFLQFDKKKGENASSFTIEDVREMQKKVFLKPLKSLKKAIILQNADTLTIPAQNALLKILEEPPDDTLIFLIAPSIDTFLPTIISRCGIVNLMNERKDNKTQEYDPELINKWKNITPQSALKLAETYSKDSKKTIKILELAMMQLREILLSDIEQKKLPSWEFTTLQKLAITHRQLTKTNVNSRMCLEAFFFSLQAR